MSEISIQQRNFAIMKLDQVMTTEHFMIPLATHRVTDINDPTLAQRPSIHGVYQSADSDYFVLAAKYESEELAHLSGGGREMDRDWITSEIPNAIDDPAVVQAVLAKGFSAVLARVNDKGELSFSALNDQADIQTAGLPW